MWDRRDHVGRWVQGICGLFLLGFVAVLVRFSAANTFHSSFRSGYARDGLGLGALYFAVRCLWYAATGPDNINRDDFCLRILCV